MFLDFLVDLLVGLLVSWPGRRAWRRPKVLAKGLRGTAMVTSAVPKAARTKVTSCSLNLQVALDSGQHYEVSYGEWVPNAFVPQLQPNAVVHVVADPKKLSRVYLVWDHND